MTVLQGESLRKYNTLYRETDSLYHMVAVRSGLSDTAFWILYAICEFGDGCLQRDICSALYVSKQTVHSAICRMEDEGYLFLEAGRGRDKHIRLTKQGEKLIEEKIAPVIEKENDVFDQMGAGNQEMLRLMEEYVRLLTAAFDMQDNR
ncbi:MAG: winged helix-turn-helix transcriptional regulator [Roseburia sp.]|jgi:DNA-binding MarR family transcriptional regulator|nr:winged helix-turn-helix transcriptional regulator [Roseburia sp.]